MRIPGKIGYAIVIDTLNGNMVLPGDIIENEDEGCTTICGEGTEKI